MSSLVLVLTDDCLVAYRRRHKVELIGNVSLDANLDAFLAELYKRHRGFCCRLILDRSDEEFVLESLPSMPRSLKKKAIGIRLSRHFGNAALTLGLSNPSQDKLSNDQVLCAGIAKKNSLQKFMLAAMRQGIVFEAIYSIAILLAYQCKRTRFRSDTLLVVSSQSGKVWRYSLVQSGRLLLSRCVFISNTKNSLQEVVAELERTHAYAGSIVETPATITTVYVGPDISGCSSQAAKLMASLRRSFSLFQSDGLYEEVIANSRFVLWIGSAYKSKQSRGVFHRYVASNVALIASFVFVSLAAINFQNAKQHDSEVTLKTIGLQQDVINDSKPVLVRSLDKELSKLKLVELRKVVDVFSSISLNDEARELEYKLALAMREYPEMSLLGVSFVNEIGDDKVESGRVDRTVLTANFLFTGLDSLSEGVTSFLKAVERSELQIVESSEEYTKFDHKGTLGAGTSLQKPYLEKFSVTVAAKEKA